MAVEVTTTIDLSAVGSAALTRSVERGLRDAMAQIVPDIERALGGQRLRVVVRRSGGAIEALVIGGESSSSSLKGGGSGKQPPPKVLMDWVRQHGLQPHDTDRRTKRRGEAGVRAVAYAIGRSIAERGRAQRAAIKTIRGRLRKAGLARRGKVPRRALALFARVMADRLRQAR